MTKLLRHCLVSIMLLISASIFAAEPFKITGTVKDSHGEPIIGAVVQEQGNGNNAATTDLVVDDFNVKARGDFAKVSKPAQAQVIQNRYFDLNKDHKWTYVGDNNTDMVPVNDCILKIGHKIGHTTYKEGGMGQIALYNAEGKRIWNVNVWYVGDLGTVDYTAGKVLNHNLGSGYVLNETFAQNWKSQGVYFQYGRSTFMTWSGSGNGVTGDGKDLVIAKDDVTDPIEFSVLHPTKMLLKEQPTSWALYGLKTIYDPCPKGYKVVNADIIKEVLAKGKPNTTGIYKLAVTLGDVTDYWVANSVFAANTSPRQGGNAYYSYWSDDASYNIYMAKADLPADNKSAAAKCRAMGVRCMVDPLAGSDTPAAPDGTPATVESFGDITNYNW